MDLNKLIVLDNLDFFAVNKPKGLVINVSTTNKTETLQEIVGKAYESTFNVHLQILKVLQSKGFEALGKKEIASILKTERSAIFTETLKSLEGVSFQLIKEFTDRSGIVHRLDKGTSGVVLVAKNATAFKKLKRNFLDRKVVKTYYAVVFGNINNTLKGNDYIHVNLPLGRNPRHRTEFAILASGRVADSMVYPASPLEMEINLKPESVKEGKNYVFSALKILPKTGRTHQIRVHLKALNHEILGDQTYMGRSQTRVAKKLNAPLMLHAQMLEFSFSGKKFKIKAPFSSDFCDVVNNIWT